MPQSSWLDPAPFFIPAGPVGCLLIHGFTGSPPEMRPMGEYLAARGVTASAPRLAGHGTTPEDLACTTWQDWYASVQKAHRELLQCCAEVFVAGFSLGALLAVHLAMHHEVSGLVLLSPGFWVRDWRIGWMPILRHCIKFVPKDLAQENSDLADPEARKRFWCYDVHSTEAAYQYLVLQRLTQSELPRVRQPTLVVYAARDQSIAPYSGPRTYQHIGAKDKELLTLHQSGHGLVVDSERETVFQRTYEWIAARRGEVAAASKMGIEPGASSR
jgi:carboxylesterase